MGRVLLCTGEYAVNPYYMDKPGRRIYSMEELCYTFQESAFLLEKEILDKKLVKWIEEECHLPKLAQQLYGFLNAKSSVSAFVATIMEYTSYCTQEEIKNVEQLLKNNQGLSAMQRGKAYADYLVQQGKYEAALYEYETILRKLQGDEEFEIRILHNMGTAYAGLFTFGKAAEYFEKCYLINGNKEHGLSFLAAKRLSMEEAEYIAFLAERPQLFALSMELEKQIEQAESQWRQTQLGSRLKEVFDLKKQGYMKEYYGKIECFAQSLMRDYRQMAEH